MFVAFRSPVLAGLACACLLSPAAAAEASYVYCDNGLRCFAAPCPSNSALDLATGKILKGVSMDTDHLPADDRNAPDLADALYAGRLVVQASIEMRAQTFNGKKHTLPFLVASHILRKSRQSERLHCSAH